MSINIIAAIGRNREIGQNGELLWSIPGDMVHFKKLTLGHCVIMGRSTWESIPERFRPLKDRQNIVLSRNKNLVLPGAEVCHSPEEALGVAENNGAQEVFIIGGEQIYQEFLRKADRLFLTIVEAKFPNADVFFPEYSKLFSRVVSEKQCSEADYDYKFVTLEKTLDMTE